MKRILGTAACALVIGAGIGCSAYNGNVSVTKEASLVSGCRQVGEVSADSKTAGAETINALADEARRKGANYVVVPEDGAHTGSAYRCEPPSAISH